MFVLQHDAREAAGVFVDGVRVMTLSDGAYFGDASLLWGVKSQYSVVTDSPCSLYVLHRLATRSARLVLRCEARLAPLLIDATSRKFSGSILILSLP